MLLASFLESGVARAGENPTLALLDFEPADSVIPTGTVRRLTAWARATLRDSGRLSVSSIDAGGPPPGARAQAASQLLQIGVEHARAERGHDARRVLAQAVSAFEADLGALADLGPLSDAYLWSGFAAMRVGRTEDAMILLRRAVALQPTRSVEPSRFGGEFVALFNRVAKGFLTGPKGSLTVRTDPVAAEVALDGAVRGVSPVAMREVPAGWHCLRVARPGRLPVARIVTIPPGKATDISLTLPPAQTGAASMSETVAAIRAKLRRGVIDAAARNLLQDLAVRALAEFVLVGYVVREGEETVLHAFVVRSQDSQLTTLAPAKFGSEALQGAHAPLAMKGLAASVTSAARGAPEKLAEDDAERPPPPAGKEVRTEGDLKAAERALEREEIRRDAELTGQKLPPEDGAAPIYKKWWFWTAVGVVTAGAVTAIVVGQRGAPGAATLTTRWPTP